VHCVGGTFVEAGIAALYFGPLVAYVNLTFIELWPFWTTVPTLVGSVAALVATSRR
jgi:NO-binding membrane sensor protein with MHYT domain